MVDLYSGRRTSRLVWLTVALVAVGVAAFFIGRAVATEAPLAVGAEHGPIHLTEEGVPYGYTQDEIGARTAALNALIGGIRLRGQVDGVELWPMRAKVAEVTDAAELFLNVPLPPALVVDLDKPKPEPTPNPQRLVYDFAPILKPGQTVTGVIAAEPVVRLGTDNLTADVSFQWIETRATAARTDVQGTNFVVKLLWDRGEDWRVVDVTAAPVDGATSVPGWLEPWTFIVSGSA